MPSSSSPTCATSIEHVEFDTIYHEHLCYFSVTSADALFRRHGLYINDVRRLPIHGGSLRLYIGKRERAERRRSTRSWPRSGALGMDSYAYYEGFAQRVRRVPQPRRGR